MLEDDQHYLQTDDQTDTKKGPFDRFAEDVQILSHVQSAVEGRSHQWVVSPCWHRVQYSLFFYNIKADDTMV